MDQMKTGRFLKELRKGKNLTQENLAEKFNVTSRTISRWETGSNMPDISILAELADFYDVDIREIIDGERKSEENMDRETMETLQMVSEYSNVKESNHVKKIMKIFLTVIIFLLSALFLSFYSRNYSSFRAAEKTFKEGIEKTQAEKDWQEELGSYSGDIFCGQSLGVCTHDETYTEPVIKNGKYYPGGDITAPYYLEVTENKYLCYKSADGDKAHLLSYIYELWRSSIENAPEYAKKAAYENGSQIRIIEKIMEPTEFKVITWHSTDAVFIYTDWEDFVPPAEGYFPGEKYEPGKTGYPSLALQPEITETDIPLNDHMNRTRNAPALDENGNYIILNLIYGGSLKWVCE